MEKTIIEKKRIGYIDALRGFTMFLVVFAHVEFFGLGITTTESLIGRIFISFRMPMFFFISGFISYKKVEWDGSYYLEMLKKKAIVQIIPTLCFFYLLCICQGDSFFSLFNKGPKGYWFTIVLFYMFTLSYTTQFICRRYKSWVTDIVLIALSLVGAFVYIGGMKFYSLGRFPLLCLINLSRYFEFFVLGYLCRKYQSRFLQIISSENVKVFLFLFFLILFIWDWNSTFISFSYLQIFNHEFTIGFVGLFFVFSIFYHYKAFFDSSHFIARSFRFVGRRTLDIYLIHFFLIPDLSFCKSTLLEMFSPKNTLIEFSVFFGITLLIVIMCLIVSVIIRYSSFLGHYLFGVKIYK